MLIIHISKTYYWNKDYWLECLYSWCFLGKWQCHLVEEPRELAGSRWIVDCCAIHWSMLSSVTRILASQPPMSICFKFLQTIVNKLIIKIHQHAFHAHRNMKFLFSENVFSYIVPRLESMSECGVSSYIRLESMSECGVSSYRRLESMSECGVSSYIRLESMCECDMSSYRRLESMCECGVSSYRRLESMSECGVSSYRRLESMCECGVSSYRRLESMSECGVSSYRRQDSTSECGVVWHLCDITSFITCYGMWCHKQCTFPGAEVILWGLLFGTLITLLSV